jgi:hypothetical protein
MSDFLNNLASRSLQLVPVVQPRLASRFEPLPFTSSFPSTSPFDMQATETEHHVEGEALNAQSRVGPPYARVIETRQRDSVSPQLPDTPLEQSTSVAGQTAHLPTQSLPLRQAVAHVAVLPVSTQTQSVHPPTTSATRTALDQTPTHLMESSRTGEATMSLAAKREGEAALENRIRRVVAGQFSLREGKEAERFSALPATPRTSQAEPEIQEQAQTIRVTIGRIDVRAINAPAPTETRRAPTRPAPQLSLEDYLKQRSGGRR